MGQRFEWCQLVWPSLRLAQIARSSSCRGLICECDPCSDPIKKKERHKTDGNSGNFKALPDQNYVKQETETKMIQHVFLSVLFPLFLLCFGSFFKQRQRRLEQSVKWFKLCFLFIIGQRTAEKLSKCGFVFLFTTLFYAPLLRLVSVHQ